MQCIWCCWSKCSNNVIYSMRFTLVTLKTLRCSVCTKRIYSTLCRKWHIHIVHKYVSSQNSDTEMLSLKDVKCSTYSSPRTWSTKSPSCTVLLLCFLQFEETRCVRKVFGISFIHFLLSSLWVNYFQSL